MPLSTPQKSALAWAAVALLLVLSLWLLGPVLMPFVVAAVLAYVLTPLVDWLDTLGRGRMPRVLAVLIVELLFILAVLGLVLLLVPVLTREWPLLREQVPQLLDRLNAGVQPLLADLGLKLAFDTASLKPALMKYLNANMEEALGSLLASLKIGGSVALTVLGNLILIPVALFYLLQDWKQLVRRVLELVPQRLRGSYDSFVAEADEVLGQYLRGQMLVMLILAIYYSVMLSFFGLDLALPIGVFTGLAIFVPYVGFGVGLVLAVLAGLLEFSGDGGLTRVALMVGVVYGLGQLLESFYLTPRLLGERIGLHPLAVIFALLAFGQLFGFVGILVALPVSAVLLVAARRLRQRYLSSSVYRA
ncbi:MAG: AI-2E family transporter [Hylemonella sp.]|uniref:AI-2E family transporter n=1 Tax=Hylemonella sp. TaxID=2066020 RepID=UPI0022C4B04F|nr:AI-2E family transporter [Hylemonella sp.]MCZ8251988.1 AI-2E family transporter [Hylemonella sp.]